MSSKTDKLIYAIITSVFLFIGVGLELSGSFVPFWTHPVNESFIEGAGNVSYSLWTKRECWNIRCFTTLFRVKWTTEECINMDGRDECTTRTGYKQKPVTECEEVFSCNTTWHFKEDTESIPSLLFMAKAFVTPGIITGIIAVILYIIKIIIFMKTPDKKTLHLRAAYLTFSAIAGAAVEIGIIIFCVMLETDKYILGWAPALPGVGGFLQLCIACGGYLSWRNGPSDDFFDDEDEAFMDKHEIEKREINKHDIEKREIDKCEIDKHELKRVKRQAPPLPPKPDALIMRSISAPASKSGGSQV